MKLPPRVSIKARPEDFIVEEALKPQPGTAGDYAIYRATKRRLTTPELQERVAIQLGLSPRALVFPALKDKRAVATQHFSLHGRGPSEISGEGFTAQFVGRLSRHLGPGNLLGNRPIIALRALAPAHYCQQHGCEYKRYEKDGRVWYSHRVGNQWCREK